MDFFVIEEEPNKQFHVNEQSGNLHDQLLIQNLPTKNVHQMASTHRDFVASNPSLSISLSKENFTRNGSLRAQLPQTVQHANECKFNSDISNVISERNLPAQDAIVDPSDL